MTAKPIRKCPECGKLKVQRLIGCGSGVIFKGSGFYETDYRSDSYKKAAAAEKGGSSSTSAKTSESSKSGSETSKGDSSKATGTTGT